MCAEMINARVRYMEVPGSGMSVRRGSIHLYVLCSTGVPLMLGKLAELKMCLLVPSVRSREL